MNTLTHKTVLCIALASAFSGIAVAGTLEPIHQWTGATIPTIVDGTLNFSSSETRGDRAALHVTNNATGVFENLHLGMNALGPKDGKNQDNQLYGVYINSSKDATFGGDSLQIDITTDFVGSGNNQASAFNLDGTGNTYVTAKDVDLSVTSKAENGKSVYGISVGGNTNLNVTSQTLDITLNTATDRTNVTYSEAIGVDVYGGLLTLSGNTTTNIIVHSTGKTTATDVQERNGASPAFGVKLEGGQAHVEGDMNITVTAVGGNATGVDVSNYFNNSTMGDVYGNSAGEFANITVSASSEAGNAYGLRTSYTNSENEYDVILSIKGNAELTATTVNEKASAISVDGKTSVEMKGNVTALAQATGEGSAYSLEVNNGHLTMEGASNILQGEVLLTGEAIVSLGTSSSSSQTSLAGDLNADPTSTLKLVNQTLTLDEGFVANIAGSLGGENSTIIYDTDEKGAVAIAKNGAKNLRVLASGRLNDLYGSAEALLDAGLVSIKNDDTVEGAGYTEGAEAGTVTDSWTVDDQGIVHKEANHSMAAFEAFNNATLVQWRNEINHLSQRLGDVRDNLGTAGAWARIYGGDSNIKNNVNVDIKSTTIQVGADTTVGNNWIIGGAFSYTNMDAEISNGDGDSDGYTLAAYASGFFDCGGYIDIVGRIGRLSTDLRASNLSSAADLDSSYDNTAFGLSGEIGYHWKLSQTFFVEPQAELAYGYVMGDDFTSSNGVKIEQDNFQTLVGRIGARFGADLPKNAGNFYLHASVNHDFLGDTDFDATPSLGNKRSFDSSIDGTWVSYGVGLQLRATDSFALYGSLERSHGDDYNDDLRYSVGGRYVW